jgi:hypothetical protein
MGMVPIIEKTMERINVDVIHYRTCEGLLYDDSSTRGT